MDNFQLKKKDGNWQLKKYGSGKASKVFKGKSKTEATRSAASMLKNRNKPSSLKIKKENGRIQEERTYPGSSDPPKSKG